MNRLISTIRITLITSLSLFAMLFLFGEEQDQNLTAWILHFLIDKTLATLAIIAAIRLHRRWSKTDPWLKACQKYTNPQK